MTNEQEGREHNNEEHYKKEKNSSQELQNINVDEKIKSILPEIENDWHIITC